MSDNVYLGVDLLEALVKSLKKNHFDYVCLTTDPGINAEDLPPALFVKAVSSSSPEKIVNFAAVESEKTAESHFIGSSFS